MVDAVDSVFFADGAVIVNEDGESDAEVFGEFGVLGSASIHHENKFAVHFLEQAGEGVEVGEFAASGGAVFAACEVEADQFAAMVAETPLFAEAIGELEVECFVAVGERKIHIVSLAFDLRAKVARLVTFVWFGLLNKFDGKFRDD